MKQTKPILFEEFKFDPLNQCVWHKSKNIGLTPKSFAVLDYLIANPSRLVTKDELLENVWSDSYVSDAVLKVCIREIRKLLVDDPKTPRFIETAHRRGYRFIAAIRESGGEPAAVAAAPAGPAFPSTLLVGRDQAQAKLREWLRAALGGSRSIIFVTGDPGTGKSTLAEAFLRDLPDGILVARGHALEQYGSGEAYMPLLEAFTAACRDDRNANVVRMIETHAPTWLAQMPGLASRVGQAALQREVLGATRDRMLREMAEAIEALSAEQPLVLLLEDLHWSDPSTIDLISYLGRRNTPARLLLIGTFRQVELILSQHSLKSVKRELQLHGMCHELPLDFLGEDDVREYINRRFSPNDFDAALASLIHSRTDGNPLFMVTENDFLEKSGAIALRDGRWQLAIPLEQVEIEMPQNLRELIQRQIGRIGVEEQSLLQVASIAGTRFSVPAVAFGAHLATAAVEEMCEGLTRRGLFIRRCGVSELPGGAPASNYEFLHSLYQNVLYDLVPMGKRLHLHRRIGEGQETLYGADVTSITAELARHFEEGREYERAVKYLFLSAENASRRYANPEAIAYLRRALDLTGRLPHAGRVGLELAALEQLGLTRRSMGEMKQALKDFDAMVSLARTSERFDIALKGSLYRASVLSWLDRRSCLEAAAQALAFSAQVDDELLRAHARGYCAYWRFLYDGWKDEYVVASQQAVEAAEHSGSRALLSLHAGRHAYFHCLSSNYEEAVRTADRGIALAGEIGDFFDHCMTGFYKAWALLHSGRWDELLQLLNQGLALTERNAHYLWKTLFNLQLAWLHLQCGSFSKAQSLCEDALEHVKETRHEFTGMMAATLLGQVFVNQGEVGRGLSTLRDVAARISRERVLMDWIWEMPLNAGLADAWLRKNQPERARLCAQRILEIAQGSREKTYTAIGSILLAEVSLAAADLSAAAAHASAAADLVEAAGLPLAALRVHGTAAKIALLQGKAGLARKYRTREIEVVDQLADSLDAAPTLRDSLVNSVSKTRPDSASAG